MSLISLVTSVLLYSLQFNSMLFRKKNEGNYIFRGNFRSFQISTTSFSKTVSVLFLLLSIHLMRMLLIRKLAQEHHSLIVMDYSPIIPSPHGVLLLKQSDLKPFIRLKERKKLKSPECLLFLTFLQMKDKPSESLENVLEFWVMLL